MLILKLLIEHGIWNQKDHDVFKAIISSCRELYDYVFYNKSLQKQLVKNLSYYMICWYPSCSFWMIGKVQEGVQTIYYSGTSRISEIANYHNGRREGMCTDYDFDQRKRAQCYYKQGQVVVSK